MKKKLTYRDKLIELVKIYNVREVEEYIKRRKNLTTGQLELILRKNKIVIPKNFQTSFYKENISKPILKMSKEIQNYKEYIQAFKLSDSKLIQKTAELINNQNIVAWFQGRMEFGARALGNRSILASPSDPEMRQRLNLIIKEREGFRPFAPSVIEEEASMWFHVKENIPYMNQVVQAKTKYLPAATHIDGSCRVHTVTQAQNKIRMNKNL